MNIYMYIHMHIYEGTECGDMSLEVLGHQTPPSTQVGEGGGGCDNLARANLAPLATRTVPFHSSPL